MIELASLIFSIGMGGGFMLIGISCIMDSYWRNK